MLGYLLFRKAPVTAILVLLLVLSGCTTVGGAPGGADGLAVTPDTVVATPPASFSDQLGWSDRLNANDGTLYRAYELDVDAEQILQISVSSERFSPVLTLYAPDGTLLQVTVDSYAYFASPAILTQRIVRGGTHLLVISAAETGSAGAFDVTSNLLEDNGEFEFPGEVTGILAPGLGETHPHTGADMQVYAFTVEEDLQAEFALSANDFDAYLSLVNAESGEEIGYNDDWGGTTDSRVAMPLAAGDYELWVTSFNPGSSGGFTLSGEETAPPEPATPLELGTEHQGQLDDNRQIIPGGNNSGVPFAIEITEDSVLDVTMVSQDVDAYLLLTDNDNNIIAEDDDSGGEVNARLVIDLDPGEYTLWASSYSVEELGNFTLRTDRVPSGEFDGTFLGDYLYHEQEGL